MIIEISKNAFGTFYWDNVKKKSLFVQNGEDINFEHEVNSKTMLEKNEQKNEVDSMNTNIDLSLLSVKQLRAIAKDQELNVKSNADKKALIATIEASMKNADSADDVTAANEDSDE